MEFNYFFRIVAFLLGCFLCGYWLHWFFARIDKAQKAYDLSVKRCHCCKQKIWK